MNKFRKFPGILAVVLLLIFNPCPSFAQLAPGGDGYVFPAGGKAGTTVKVILGGGDWTPDTKFIVHDSRIRLDVFSKPGPVLMPLPPYYLGIKSFLNDPRLPREISGQFTIPANFPPGPVHWSVANANGAGGGGVFIVSNNNEIREDEEARGIQVIPSLPATINGRLGRIEEVDQYKFVAKENGLVTCDLMARRLGSDFYGVIEVRDSSGQRVADVVSTLGRDPVLDFAAEKGKEYIISVRDLDHAGYRCYTYRLSLSTGPRILATLPAAGKQETSQEIELVGIGLESGRAVIEKVKKKIQFPGKTDQTNLDITVETPDGKSAPFTIQLTDLEEKIRNPDLKAGEMLTSSSPMSACFESGGLLLHSYRFVGKKGSLIDIGIHMPDRAIPMELAIQVFDSSGKPVASKEIENGSNHLLQEVSIPADGEYRIEIRNLAPHSQGSDAIYRISITTAIPSWELRTAGLINIPVGGKGTVPIQVVRKGGFQGPIELAFKGLPIGITPGKETVIPAKADTFNLSLECSPKAASSFGLVEITGTSKEGGKILQKKLGFGLRGNLQPGSRDSNLSETGIIATTIKPPFKLKAAEADGGRRIPRGSTHLAEILVERQDGFNGEIILDMAASQQRHRQGIRGPSLAVAPGIRKIDYPVFLPEILETSKTSRIGLVGMAKVADPAGIIHDILTPMEGQITMSIEGALLKVSHPGDEIVVKPGQSFELPLRLARNPKLQEPVSIDVMPPSAIKYSFVFKPFSWPASSETASIRVETKNNPVPPGIYPLTIKATAIRNGFPVVSEAVVEIEIAGPGNVGVRPNPR